MTDPYAIYGNMYHQYTPNVGKYTIHGFWSICFDEIHIFFMEHDEVRRSSTTVRLTMSLDSRLGHLHRIGWWEKLRDTPTNLMAKGYCRLSIRSKFKTSTSHAMVAAAHYRRHENRGTCEQKCWGASRPKMLERPGSRRSLEKKKNSFYCLEI